MIFFPLLSCNQGYFVVFYPGKTEVHVENKHLYGVIMAGGRGERFWPLGRTDRPKQLLPLLGETTLLEESFLRLLPMFPPENILVITNEKYVEHIREILPVPPENIIGEPVGRDTAPCVALAAALLLKKDPEAVMVVLPADHIIRPAKIFQKVIANAVEEAQKEKLVTLGITPTYPATGYGYIHAGEEVSPGFHGVLAFKEKPDHETAEIFFQSGEYRWNCGVFVWRADVIARAMNLCCPELGAFLEKWRNGADYRKDFADCPKISIDYAVMEKASNVLMADTSFFWKDVGGWKSLRSILPLDESGNAIRGKAIAIQSTNNLLISDDETMLGVIGMRDVAVVKAGNGILVCPLAEEQAVKELVAAIKTEYPDFL